MDLDTDLIQNGHLQPQNLNTSYVDQIKYQPVLLNSDFPSEEAASNGIEVQAPVEILYNQALMPQLKQEKLNNDVLPQLFVAH